MHDDYSEQYPRKMWFLGKHENHVLAFENGAFIIGDVDKHRVNEVKQAFQSGTPALSLTKETFHIPLESLKSIRASTRQPIIQVSWEPDSSSDNYLFHRTKCRDQEQCQEVMDALHALPFPTWSRDTMPDPLGARVYIPIVGMIIAALVAWGMWALSNAEPQQDGRPGHARTNWIGVIVVMILRVFGPKGTMLIAFLIIMFFAAWLLYALHFSTQYDTLTPDLEQPDTDE